MSPSDRGNHRTNDGQLQPLLDPGEQEDEDTLGLEKRQELEAALLKKVDKRMSILVLIYILNCKLPPKSSPPSTELLLANRH